MNLEWETFYEYPLHGDNLKRRSNIKCVMCNVYNKLIYHTKHASISVYGI